MNTRPMIFALLSTMIVACLAVGAERPPNIIVILADDLGCRDLKKDLKETTNIATENPGITKSMRHAIEGFGKNVVSGS